MSNLVCCHPVTSRGIQASLTMLPNSVHKEDKRIKLPDKMQSDRSFDFGKLRPRLYFSPKTMAIGVSWAAMGQIIETITLLFKLVKRALIPSGS